MTAPSDDPRVINIDDLTPREAEILRLVAMGLKNKEIGRRLGISELTVKTYLRSVFSKLGVNNRTQAAILVYDGRPGEYSLPNASDAGCDSKALTVMP